MEEDTEKKSRRSIKRSPSYPKIGLEEAIQRAKILWEKDKNNSIPKEVAYQHLGFKSTGGYAARILAALKKFELISEKQNDIMLTKEAVDLVLHSPSDENYIETVKKLALKPSIYEKLYTEYNGILPSDAALRIKLIRDYEFNADSVDDLVSNFRKTLEFAGLIEIGEIKENVERNRDTSGSLTATLPPLKLQGSGTTTPKKEESLTIPILLPEGNKIYITFERLPIKEKDIKLVSDWLKLFAPSLTGIESDTGKSEGES